MTQVSPSRQVLQDRGIIGPLVCFDGVCGLCDRFVQFVLRRDRRGLILFTPLQGDTFAALFPAHPERGLASLVLWDGDRCHEGSTAVLRTLLLLGGGWWLVGRLCLLVPRPVREVVYRIVARNRYRAFGRFEQCLVPPPEVRKRFVD
jgi:predicted DCC family thiol-disulfide oxidoreductase YuxK